MKKYFITRLILILLLCPASWISAVRAQIVVGVRPVQPNCAITADPIPSGITHRPNENISMALDHFFMHSATHLQGNETTEKFAPCLFYEPQDAFYSFRSVVMVNNPNPQLTINVVIQYYDPAGNPLLPVSNVTLQPEETHIELATPLQAAGGKGSARITSQQHPFVGATFHQTYVFDGCTDPDHQANPGMTSFQQLQEDKGKNDLYWGPLPASNSASTVFNNDFLNGNLPIFCLMNPSPTLPATATITYVDRLGATPAPVVVTIPPNGSFTDLTLAAFLYPVYTGAAFSFDNDYGVIINSDQPLLGEGIMMDFFGDGAPWNLNKCDRFRMGSTMLANKSPRELVNPEFTYQVPNTNPAGPFIAPITTYMGFMNVKSQNIGPVNIRYFNRNGNLLAQDTIAAVPFGALHRIAPGSTSTPNYPTTTSTFDGWVRIQACKPGLVGWTMREARHEPIVVNNWQAYFRKVWGETLDGTNFDEPGPGFPVTTQDGFDVIRKVAPILQVDPSFYWPGYEAILNKSTSNILDYWYRFFRLSPGTDLTNYLIQPYAGLRWGNTSFTFEDVPINHTSISWLETLSGRADITQGKIKGIDAVGDPLWEYAWGGQIVFPFGPPNPPDLNDVQPFEH